MQIFQVLIQMIGVMIRALLPIFKGFVGNWGGHVKCNTDSDLILWALEIDMQIEQEISSRLFTNTLL